LRVLRKILHGRRSVVALGLRNATFVVTQGCNSLSRERIREHQERLMSSDGFISIDGPGTAEQNCRREWPGTRGKGQRSCKRRFPIASCKRYFFFLVGLGLRWVLRPPQFQNLIRTPEIQLFVISVLAPVSGDLIFCSA